MEFKQKITDYSLRHYKPVTIVMAVATLVLGALIPLIKVDTDPENMLSAEEPVRLFHNQTKRQFDLSDIVVVGIVNEKDPNGVFNPASLARIYELTEFAKTLRWPDEHDPNRQIRSTTTCPGRWAPTSSSATTPAASSASSRTTQTSTPACDTAFRRRHASGQKKVLPQAASPEEFVAVEVNQVVRNLSDPDLRFPCYIWKVALELL